MRRLLPLIDDEVTQFSANDFYAVIQLFYELALRDASRANRIVGLALSLKRLFRAEGVCIFESRGQIITIMTELHRQNWEDSQTENLFRRLSGRNLPSIVGHPSVVEWSEPNPRRRATMRYRCLVGCLPAGVDYFITMAFVRIDQPFTTQDVSLLRTILLSKIASLMLSICKSRPVEMTTRMREVLSRLMEGDSEKEVAKKLKLSQHTVHVYVKQLHKRFGVRSRGELLSLTINPIAKLTQLV